MAVVWIVDTSLCAEDKTTVAVTNQRTHARSEFLRSRLSRTFSAPGSRRVPFRVPYTNELAPPTQSHHPFFRSRYIRGSSFPRSAVSVDKSSYPDRTSGHLKTVLKISGLGAEAEQAIGSRRQWRAVRCANTPVCPIAPALRAQHESHHPEANLMNHEGSSRLQQTCE